MEAILMNKLINWKTLAGLFVVIVLLSELIGGGTYFYTSGIIHLISVLYLLLIVLVIAKLPNLKNSKYRIFFSGFILASAILSFTHVIEYIGGIFIKTEILDKAMDLTVIAISIISLVLLLISVEAGSHPIFIKLKKFLFLQITIAVIMTIGITTLYFLPELLNNIQNLALWLVLNAMLVAAVLSIESFRMANKFPILKDFLKNISDGVIVLTLSIIFESLEILDIPQIATARSGILSHYLFFLAMSVILLGFMKIYNMGGVYEESPSDTELLKQFK